MQIAITFFKEKKKKESNSGHFAWEGEFARGDGFRNMGPAFQRDLNSLSHLSISEYQGCGVFTDF